MLSESEGKGVTEDWLMNKFEIQTQATRAKIIDEFWALLVKEGLQKITVRQITEGVGINRGTFYLHFIDVWDLLEQEENILIQEWIKETNELFSAGQPGSIIKAITSYYERNADHVFLLLENDALSGFSKRIKEMLFNTLSANTHGEFSPDFEWIFEYAIDGLLGILQKWYRDGKIRPLNEVIGIALSLLPLEKLSREASKEYDL